MRRLVLGLVLAVLVVGGASSAWAQYPLEHVLTACMEKKEKEWQEEKATKPDPVLKALFETADAAGKAAAEAAIPTPMVVVRLANPFDETSPVTHRYPPVHRSLRVTPAMAAGVTDRVWGLEEIIA